MAQEDMSEDCEPCYFDALVISSFDICKRNTSGEESSECESLHEQYLMDEITLQQYLKGIEKLVTDPMAAKTLKEMQKVAEEDGVE